MVNEQELKEDIEKLCQHVECFQEKYGGCVLSAAAVRLDEEKAVCPIVLVGKGEVELPLVCHGLLRIPRFIDEFFDAMKCILHHANPKKNDHFGEMLMETSLDSMKKLFILNAIKQREEDPQNIVDKFLNDFYEDEKRD